MLKHLAYDQLAITKLLIRKCKCTFITIGVTILKLTLRIMLRSPLRFSCHTEPWLGLSWQVRLENYSYHKLQVITTINLWYIDKSRFLNALYDHDHIADSQVVTWIPIICDGQVYETWQMTWYRNRSIGSI